MGIALWVALWLVLGLWTGVEMWRLSELTMTVADSGRALDEAGMTLQSLSGSPSSVVTRPTSARR